ncbi:hypothetical protein ASG01_06100 [Chryseobacterium sp. Leaf180]|uniref:DUF4296 domain-containing protein n=1 Tax=Chryseobacterium sp. Leaf180 TaxID=1736289 RepID=UPI0006F7E01B|nr:DUF4296 domain-containing protein [Chryseobacterium sp. Leaf180]KQR95414.1 hypothetical protein ASG01_06100 [Chryseobacterium sp. Leaf180]
MKRFLILSLLMMLASCSDYIEKPENLVDKTTMADILVDLAVAEQVIYTYQGKDLESETKYILKSHNVKQEDFLASYKYYVVKRKMKKITEEAQEKLLEKDPKAEKFIQDRLKGNPIGAPALIR